MSSTVVRRLTRRLQALKQGMETFGASAPYKALYEHFGFTPENVADTVRAVLAK